MATAPAHANTAAVSAAASGWRWAAYELVLRRLPADDHLCTALACRAFRGILYVRAVTEPTSTIVGRHIANENQENCKVNG